MPAFVHDADLLICEGTYGSNEDLPKAEENRHMSFAEAAAIARQGKVKQLWLTHFSPALTEPEAYAAAARAIFPNTVIGHDRMCTTLRYG
jgi:ribonuclease Z